MNWKEKPKRENISEEEWKIVEERLKTMPDKMRLGILSNSFTKQKLIEEVKKGLILEELMLRCKWIL